MELIKWLFLAFFPVLLLAVLQFRKTVDRWRNQQCYLLSYKLFKAPEDQKLDVDSSVRILLNNSHLGLPEYRFLLRTLSHSGIGESTYAPKLLLAKKVESACLADALTEMEEIIFHTLNQVFEACGCHPKEIDILVLNVASFAPVPSLTSRIINRYKMKEDVKVYNLSGMGCSASVVAIDLVQQLFKVYKNALAIVVSTEALGPNWYCGKERSMMLPNCLFRVGGCSMLLTNNRTLKKRALLGLKFSVRTHIGSDDKGYNSCIEEEDDSGYRGHRLTKDLPRSGVKALTENFKVLVPKILPVWELVRYVAVALISRASRLNNGVKVIPNFGTGLDHFCIHPGGKAVIDNVGRGLGLREFDLEPARMALHKFGNTSSTGIWYVLGYMEAKKRLKLGHRVLMISLGAGFKCNTCVWEVLRDTEDRNVWDDCIDIYPHPKSVANPFEVKFGWIYDESLDLITEQEIAVLKQRFS